MVTGKIVQSPWLLIGLHVKKWFERSRIPYVCEELVGIFIQDKTIPNKTKMAIKETVPRFQLIKCKTR